MKRRASETIEGILGNHNYYPHHLHPPIIEDVVLHIVRWMDGFMAHFASSSESCEE